MHAEAYDWASRHATDDEVAVLDIGGRDINGTCRNLFPNAKAYHSIDLVPGNAVDIVGDVTRWKFDRRYNVVVCCEVLEHTKDWRGVIAAAYRACEPGGRLVVTAASPGREPHSTMDGGELREGEYYQNVDPDELREALEEVDWEDITIDVQDRNHDVRAAAHRAPETVAQKPNRRSRS